MVPQVIKDSASAAQTPQQPVKDSSVQQVAKPAATDSAQQQAADTSKHKAVTDTAKQQRSDTTKQTQSAHPVAQSNTVQQTNTVSQASSVAPQPTAESVSDATATVAEELSAQELFARQYPFLAASAEQGDWHSMCEHPLLADSLFMPRTAVDDTCDSVYLSPFADEADSVEYCNSIFSGHLLQPTHSEFVPRKSETYDSIFAIAIVFVGLVACVYYRFHRLTISEVVSAFFNDHAFGFIQRERNMLHASNFMIALPVMAATFALYAYSIRLHLNPYNIGFSDYLVTFAIFVGIMVVLYLRNVVIYFFGHVFENPEGVERYVLQGYLNQMLASTILLPMLLLFVYMPLSPTAYILSTAIPMGLLLLVGLVRGIHIFLIYPRACNLFLIYYLCILDIVPILILLKVLI